MKTAAKWATTRPGFIVLLLGLSLQSLAAAEEIIVRARLDQETAWAGQRVQLQVDVLGRNGWAQAKPAEEITIPGGYVLPAGNNRVRLQETIDGEDYSGQRYEWFLYLQRSGATQIPRIDLQVSLQTWGVGGGTVERTASTPALALQVELPPGVDPALPLIVSPGFSAQQTWEPDSSELRVGDALKRVITLQANDLPAMVLPPLPTPEAPGMGMYPADPQVEDLPDGSGRRRQSITYVCQSAALPELPTYHFQWWNPQTRELRQVALPGRSLTITGLAARQDAPAEPPLLAVLLLILLTGAILALLIWRLPRRVPSDETLRFKAVLRCTRRKDPPAACHALLLWIEALPDHSGGCLAFLEKHSAGLAARIATRLLRDPHQNYSSAELRQLATELRRARRNHRKARKRSQRTEQHLPPLNGPIT